MKAKVPRPHESHMQPWPLLCLPLPVPASLVNGHNSPLPGPMLVTTNMLGTLLLATAGDQGMESQCRSQQLGELLRSGQWPPLR